MIDLDVRPIWTPFWILILCVGLIIVTGQAVIDRLDSGVMELCDLRSNVSCLDNCTVVVLL